MKYGFYPGCSFKSAAGYQLSVAALTRAVGIEFVEIPDWNCCGATVFFSLDDIKAVALAGRVFALAAAGGFREIVTGCNACYATLRKSAELLAKKPDYLSALNRGLALEQLHLAEPLPVRHILQVLVDDLPHSAWASQTKRGFESVPVAGYYGCQLTRPFGDADDPEQPGILERFIKRLGFQPVAHSAKTLCCGASHGVPYGDECSPLIARIVRGAHEKGARLIATVCPLCQFNLDQGQQRASGLPKLPVLFFTQLAGLALGLPPEELGLDQLLISAQGVLRQR